MSEEWKYSTDEVSNTPSTKNKQTGEQMDYSVPSFHRSILFLIILGLWAGVVGTPPIEPTITMLSFVLEVCMHVLFVDTFQILFQLYLNDEEGHIPHRVNANLIGFVMVGIVWVVINML